MTVNNRELQAHLKDAIEEVGNLASETVWKVEGPAAVIYDKDGNFLGRVNVKICCGTGKVTFSYKHDRATYTGIAQVVPVTIDVAIWNDPAELAKLAEFDSAIIAAHSL